MSFEGEHGTLSHEFETNDEGGFRWIATFETTISNPRDLWRDWVNGTRNLPEARRLLCYFLVRHLPEDGLIEAVESLNGINVFYSVNPPQLPSSRILPKRTGTASKIRTRSKLVIEP